MEQFFFIEILFQEKKCLKFRTNYCSSKYKIFKKLSFISNTYNQNIYLNKYNNQYNYNIYSYQ